MMLTNYPLDRALVAERQRDQRADAERRRRARPSRPSRPSRLSSLRWRLPSWLPRPSTRRGDATGAATA